MRWLIAIILAAGVSAEDLGDRIRAAQSAANYGEAAKLYLELIASGTDTPQVRSNCGVMLHLAGQNREAMKQFRIALQREPSLAGANLFAGLAELDLGEPQLALPYLKRAQESDARQPAPLLALGKAHASLHQYTLANESYAKAADLDPKLADAWYGVGVTDRSMAEELLNRASRHGEKNGPSQAKAQDLLAKALQALSRAMELEPDSARAHLVMAESLSDSGKMADSIREYETAMKLDPRLDGAYLGLATLYWKQRQFDQALPLLKHLLANSPKDPEANGMMADISQHAGNDSDAKRYADLALAGNPNLIETRVVLARVYVAKQEPKLAIDELQKVIAADPDGSYHFLLYRAYRMAGDEKAAKTALAQFQQLRKSSGQQ